MPLEEMSPLSARPSCSSLASVLECYQEGNAKHFYVNFSRASRGRISKKSHWFLYLKL